LLGLFQAELLKIAQFANGKVDTHMTRKAPPTVTVKGGPVGIPAVKMRQKGAHWPRLEEP
jgi:hypothetical protein